MKHAGAMGLTKPTAMKSAGKIALPKAKVHPAAMQKTRVRLPQGDETPSDPGVMLPNVGKL